MDARKEFDRLRNRGILAEECGTVCVCCGSMEGIAYHHILPLAMGGDNRISNIVPVCEVCHGKIHGKHMTCLQRFSERNGRPRNDAPAGYREAITRYITAGWDGKEVRKELGLSEGMKISELWYYKEFLEKNGVKKVEKKGGRGAPESIIYYKDGREERYAKGTLV